MTYLSDSISTLYLNGQGERSYFDLRGYRFQALNVGEVQEKVPLVHPSLSMIAASRPRLVGSSVSISTLSA